MALFPRLGFHKNKSHWRLICGNREKVEELKQQEQEEKERIIDKDEGMIPPIEEKITPSEEMVEAEKKAEVLQAQLEQQTKQDQEAQKLKDLQKRRLRSQKHKKCWKNWKNWKSKSESCEKTCKCKTRRKSWVRTSTEAAYARQVYRSIKGAWIFSRKSITQLYPTNQIFQLWCAWCVTHQDQKIFNRPRFEKFVDLQNMSWFHRYRNYWIKTQRSKNIHGWSTYDDGVDALRRAMSALGITDSHTQDDKIFELFNSANAPKSENGQDLDITNKDTLQYFLRRWWQESQQQMLKEILEGGWKIFRRKFEK